MGNIKVKGERRYGKTGSMGSLGESLEELK